MEDLSTDRLTKLRDRLREFVRERDWEQFHSPKNLAMAMIVEAAELVEHFQWMTEQESRELGPDKLEQVAQEIADTFVYLLRLSDVLGLDMVDIANRKIDLNAQKYPADKVRGSNAKYTEY